MNRCDWNHETRSEIRRLPTSSDGAVLCCKVHFLQEMKWWKELGTDKNTKWEDLEIVEEMVR